jgi:hypothetical protein
MSEQTNDIIHDLLTTVVKEPKKRGPKPKTAEEKEAIKIEKKLKKQAEKEKDAEQHRKWAEANPYKYKQTLYFDKKLSKDDPDYDAIHKEVEKAEKDRNEFLDSMFKPAVTSVVPVKYKSPMDEIREVMKVIDEEEEKKRKEEEKINQIIEENKRSAPLKTMNTHYESEPRDIISELFEQMKEEERRNAIAKERRERSETVLLEEEIKKARLRYEEHMKEEEEQKKKKKEDMWDEKEEVEHYKEQMALIKKEEED